MHFSRFFKGLFITFLLCFIFQLPLFSQTLTALQKREKFISCAQRYLGVPYKYGGTTAGGMDCSGFVYASAIDSGVLTLPRTVASMYSAVSLISDSAREKGDLVFFKTTGSSVSHVGIYLGDGKFIHCASEGSKTGVITSTLQESYWKRTYCGSGRAIQAAYIADSGKTSGSTTSGTSTSGSSKKPASGGTSVSAKKTSSSGTSIFESCSSTSHKRASIFVIDAGAFISWSFFNAYGIKWEVTDLTVQAALRTDCWKINPGLMVRANFLNQYAQPLLIDLCALVTISDYFSFYGGVVFSQSQPRLRSSYDYAEYPVFPGIFGLSVQTPHFSVFGYKISLRQDISWTNVNSASGYPLSFKEKFADGINFSTGLCLTLPL